MHCVMHISIAVSIILFVSIMALDNTPTDWAKVTFKSKADLDTITSTVVAIERQRMRESLDRKMKPSKIAGAPPESLVQWINRQSDLQRCQNLRQLVPLAKRGCHNNTLNKYCQGQTLLQTSSVF